MKNYLIKYENSLPILLGIVLFLYLVLRVFIMPISDDEYITVDLHASMNWWNILITGQPQLDWAPNNHILNTLFMKLEIGIFGRKDWAVRLHILVAFAISFYYSTKTIQYFTSSRLRQILYLLILYFNPYLLDFFGIARGYAISIAGFSAAFYYFLLYTENLSLQQLRNTFVALFIAVWSNFSSLYLLALMVILFCFEIYNNKKKIDVKRHLIFIAVACLVILIIIIFPLIKTLSSKDTFGGKTGLFQDCIVNYINQFIHHNSQLNRHAIFTPGWKYIEITGIIILSLWVILQLISFLFKADNRLTKIHNYSLFLILGVASIAKFLFIFFGTPYPTARTELLFSVPFYLSICIAFERIISMEKHVVIALWLIIGVLTWHFSYSVTFENTIEWWQNGDAKRVVSYLKEELNDNKSDKVLRMGVEGWQYHSLAFYTEVEFKDILTIYWTDLSSNDNWDYLFVPFNLTDKVWDNYVAIKKFKHGTLYRLKEPKQIEIIK
jgi:hypothetical protein